MADVDLTPTAEMARNAARGLELRREHGRGGTEVGVARARDISNGKTLSPETVRRMHAFFSRHAKNKAGGEDDAGYIAWMLWGGDEGRDWASRKVDALDRKERNAMSETRKAIMERLGMAAQKVARFRVGKDLSGGYSVVPMKADGSVETSVYEEIGFRHSFPTADAALAKAKQMQAKYGGTVTMEDKQVSSRPGAKAKMGKFKVGDRVAYKPHPAHTAGELVEIRQPTSLEGVEMQYGIKQASGGIMWVPEGMVVRASRPGAKAKMDKNAAYIEYANLRETTSKLENRIARAPASDKPRLMAELAKQVQRMKELSQILRASRPGAKAKFDSNQVAFFLDALASQVIDQKDLAKKNAQSAADYVFKHGTDAQIKRFVQLAERVGLRVNMSRPGAKVRAALADACWEGYEAVGTKPQDGKTVPNCVPKMKAGRAEDLYRKLSGGTITNANVREWDRLVTEALRMPDFTPPGGDMSLHEIAEELGGEIMALKSRAAKAQAAKPAETPAMRELQRKMQELMQKADRLLKQSLSASVTSEQSQQMQDEVERISEQLDAMGEDLARQRKAAGFEKPSDLEREDVKAGLKLMAASDPAVSDKIRTLIKEGKPQDQAVAIALDMKRRGEL